MIMTIKMIIIIYNNMINMYIYIYTWYRWRAFPRNTCFFRNGFIKKAPFPNALAIHSPDPYAWSIRLKGDMIHTQKWQVVIPGHFSIPYIGAPDRTSDHRNALVTSGSPWISLISGPIWFTVGRVPLWCWLSWRAFPGMPSTVHSIYKIVRFQHWNTMCVLPESFFVWNVKYT